MDMEEFESWFIPSPRRLQTLKTPPNYWRRLSVGLLLIACLMGIAWKVLK